MGRLEGRSVIISGAGAGIGRGIAHCFAKEGAQLTLAELDAESGIYTEDVMDFWRPNYRDEALVDGKASVRVYIRALQECWRQYSEATGRGISDFSRSSSRSALYSWEKPITALTRMIAARIVAPRRSSR